MKYKLVKNGEIFRKEKFGINLLVYPAMGNCEVVVAETETGHNQEFYQKISVCNYIILEGSGSFFLDGEEVKVSKGDLISIEPNTRIYYKGKMKLILVTTPPWQSENEVETNPKIW
jgi:mannose-6-phosphate isomerase class I